MFAIPSQFAYRSAEHTVPFDVGMGDQVLERAKAQRDSTWLVIRSQPRPMDSPFWYSLVPQSAHNFGCLAEFSDAFNGVGQRVPLIDPANVDFAAVKPWFTHCTGQHGELCNPDSVKRSLPKGIAVINYTTRDLEPLPTGARFAALSYVWGDNTSATESYSSISRLPQTIEDTIAVALEIGIQFLWPELPGIRTPRVKPPSLDLCLGRHRLVSTGRTWTYQEGLVSRRKLVFTDEQVYLHCMEREFRETIEQDFYLLAQTRSDDVCDPFHCSTLHLIAENDGPKDAFPDSFRHIWGQPIPCGANNSIGDAIVSALNWGIIGPTQRRPDFPSWSWIGWKGKAYSSVNESCKEDVTASLLLEDGTTIDNAKVFRDLNTFQRIPPLLSKYILIEAQIVHVRIRRKEGDYWNLRNMWKLSFVKDGAERYGITYADGFSITQEYEKRDDVYRDLEGGNAWLGIAFPRSDMVLVLKDKGDYHERFGYIDVDFLYRIYGTT
ncbi:uncharacterized protein BKA55DRAFT_597729 [Fusarium redolens]|uniref:Heterokaryon incompatibility domain-containing protein n=1 Tax=Fusarium redolens TaxID=48865 RepID=A0A9P9GB65_FUSRE|nr:uncharacterized protein BKA55DRAFT_597729 [Fusarium redolens]KAH7234729.1 hypothetical protein BKA55DRAFT_597729 [Fusarium redolens]